MQIRSKIIFRTGTVLLGVMLAMVLFVAVSNNQQAKALDTTQWDTVRGYIAEYFGGPQYNAGLDGEAGFRINKTNLRSRLDSSGDISPVATGAAGSTGTTVTGAVSEGDDMATRPVLIDNLRTQTGIIPGTEFRCNWNTNEDCFSDSSITSIRQIVDNHQAAGFSTDIVDYCVSAQTAGPSTGGFAIIAQVPGALASDTALTPNVYTLDFARNGWRNAPPTALVGTNGVAAPEASAGGLAAPGTVANCNAAATDYDLVRCQANWAISSTGGNVGNGQQVIATIAAAQQSVDIRPGTVNTMNTATSTNNNLQAPVNSLFSVSGLANIDPAKTTVMVTRTQMGADAAIGLKMLGYNLIPGGSISTGIARWNSGEGEQQVASGDGMPLQSIVAWDGLTGHPPAAPGPIDMTGPSVSSVSSLNVTDNSADINRVAGESATMKVEYGTVSGVYTDTVNNTVLNASKTVALSGLSASTTYYYKVTSYDGQANGTVSAEGSLTTAAPPCTPAKPNLHMKADWAKWASYADYTARELSVKLTVSNTGIDTGYGVAITGSVNSNSVTLSTATPIALGDIAGSGSATTWVKYHIPVGVTQFSASLTGSATDVCNTSWTYP